MTLRQDDDDSRKTLREVTPATSFSLDTRHFLPVRYALKEDEDGRYLTCVDAPNLAVRLTRDFSVSASAARKFPECTIFLDGAAQSEPFMDVQRRVYNLDHHEGCVRAFSLATCEQAMVVVVKGLDLGGENWNIYGNEPDLDTVMAVWILLNHTRMTGPESDLRRRIMPVVRLQGVIDAHGFEMRELAAFPEAMEAEVSADIQRLRSRELELKTAGKWGATDPLEYAVEALQSIDEMVYSPHDFMGERQVDELLRLPIGYDRIVLACTADVGIYEVEQHLKAVHGDRIGVIILDKGRGTFTLRQVDPFLPMSLDAIYNRLNQMDPAVKGASGWGGSSDIGGSPRRGGSALNARQVAEVCRWVYRSPSSARRLGMAALAFVAPLLGLGLLLGLVHRGLPIASDEGLVSTIGARGYGNFSVLFAAALLVVIPAVARGRHRLFGLGLPTSWRWLGLLPFAFLGALAGGAWAPLDLAAEAGGPINLGWAYLTVTAASVIAAELLFRGLVHGLLMSNFNVASPAGRWTLSTPNLVAAAGYGVAVVLLFEPAWWQVTGQGSSAGGAASTFAAAFALGVTAGLGRERWGSVLVSVILHLAAAAVAWFLLPLLA